MSQWNGKEPRVGGRTGDLAKLIRELEQRIEKLEEVIDRNGLS